jgi:hypothetical protein
MRILHGWIMRICRKLTNHKWRKLEGVSFGILPTEYYYKCQVCQYRFWNYNAPIKSKEIKQLEKWEQENV